MMHKSYFFLLCLVAAPLHAMDLGGLLDHMERRANEEARDFADPQVFKAIARYVDACHSLVTCCCELREKHCPCPEGEFYPYGRWYFRVNVQQQAPVVARMQAGQDAIRACPPKIKVMEMNRPHRKID